MQAIKTGKIVNNLLTIANRNPTNEKDAFTPFWLNLDSKEIFQFLNGEWTSLTKQYIKINQTERSKPEDSDSMVDIRDLKTHKTNMIHVGCQGSLYETSQESVFQCGKCDSILLCNHECSKPEDSRNCRKCMNEKEEGESHCAFCGKYL